MSNLYKNQYVINNFDNKKIINSNEKVTECMNNYIQMKKEEALAEGGFVEGLNAESVEVVPNEETEEILPDQVQEEEIDPEVQAQEIIDSAKEEASKILEDAKLQAEHMREQALLEGKETGYAEGSNQAMQEIQSEQQKLKDLEQQLQDDHEKRLCELEPKLVDVISDVVENVFHIRFEDDKKVIFYLVQNAILSADGCKEFRIHVGADSYPYVSAHKPELTERVGKDLKLDIIEDAALSENECMIETDAGVFDCGVGVQMENLMKELKMLSL